MSEDTTPTIWETLDDWWAATSRADLANALSGEFGDAEAAYIAEGAKRLDPDSAFTVWLEDAGETYSPAAVQERDAEEAEGSPLKYESTAPCRAS